jgi:hypothetical protein
MISDRKENRQPETDQTPGRRWLFRMLAKTVLTVIFSCSMWLAPLQVQGGTAGKAYNLSLDIGSMDNQPLYYITSFPTTIKIRAKVIDQTGAPITGLTSTQLIIQSAKNATTRIVWTPGTEYSIGTFTELGNGLYDWTATLNPGALATNNVGRFEVRVTGTPATDNQWLASTIFVKNSTNNVNDVKYVEAQPAVSNAEIGSSTGGSGLVNVKLFGPFGQLTGPYGYYVLDDNNPNPNIFGYFYNWFQSSGTIYPTSVYYIRPASIPFANIANNFSIARQVWAEGGLENLEVGRQYITIGFNTIYYFSGDFLVPIGLTSVLSGGTNPTPVPVPTYTYPALFPATTVINDYTNSGSVIVPPGGSSTKVNTFRLSTNSASLFDTVQGIALELGTGVRQMISRIEITDSLLGTTLASLTNPDSDTPLLVFTSPVVVTSTEKTFNIQITPKSHADMPPPPGESPLILANVVSIDHTASHAVDILQSSISPYVTIDNLSPANPVWGTITSTNTQINLSWASPSDSYGAVILRSKTPITDTPIEGQYPFYTKGDVIGSSTVVYSGLGTSCADTGLEQGVGYYYRIFAKDKSNNYSAGGAATGPHVPGYQTTPGSCTATATGATSMKVTMSYVDDANGNNSYAIDYRHSNSDWTNWVTASPHTASPFITTITGLSQATSYDVRCTYTDPEGVWGLNPQIAYGIVLLDNRTTTGVPAATAISNSVLSVSVPYTGDDNSTSSIAVEYKLSRDSNWTNGVTVVPHSPSPFVATITGLEQAENYDVRVTFIDPDGALGDNPQTISMTRLQDYRTTTGEISAEGSAPSSIRITVPFFYDDNRSGKMVLAYRKSSDTTWMIGLGPVPYLTSPHQSFIKGLTPNTVYDIKVTYLDPDGVVGMAEQVVYGVITPPSKLIHNSLNANNKGYWAEYGGWGVPGGQYEEFTCLTCHTKRTPNASGIRTYINLSPLEGSDNFGGPVRFDGTTGPNSFGDDSVSKPDPQGAYRICEVCHTRTYGMIGIVYNESSQMYEMQSGPIHQRVMDSPSNHVGSNGQDCIQCHRHDKGFATRMPWE